MLVVMSMERCPPQHAFLRARLREKREDELKNPTGLEGSMREIAMVSGGDAEHANDVQRCADGHRPPCDAGDQCEQTGRVNGDERDCGWIDDVVVKRFAFA